MLSISHVQLFVTPWTVAYQAPPSMGFFQARVLEWIAISFFRGSSQPRIAPRSPALQADALPSKPPGKPQNVKKNMPYPLPRLSWILSLHWGSWWSSLYQPVQLSDSHLPFFCSSSKPSQLPGTPSPACLTELQPLETQPATRLPHQHLSWAGCYLLQHPTAYIYFIFCLSFICYSFNKQ